MLIDDFYSFSEFCTVGTLGCAHVEVAINGTSFEPLIGTYYKIKVIKRLLDSIMASERQIRN